MAARRSIQISQVPLNDLQVTAEQGQHESGVLVQAAEKRAEAAEARMKELENELRELRDQPAPAAPSLDYTELRQLRKTVQATLEEARRKLEQWWVVAESSARRELGRCADGLELVLQKLQKYESSIISNGGVAEGEELPEMSLVGSRMSVPCTKPRMVELDKLAAQHGAVLEKLNFLRGALGLEPPTAEPSGVAACCAPTAVVESTRVGRSTPEASCSDPRKLAERLYTMPEVKLFKSSPRGGKVRGKVHSQLRDKDKKPNGTKVLAEVKEILQKQSQLAVMAVMGSQPLPPISSLQQAPGNFSTSTPPKATGLSLGEVGTIGFGLLQKHRERTSRLSRGSADAAQEF
eukprot:TRINITY_DN5592_c0_g1_i5.p1 TRINITY_DN5592_c0_g1~~TRINITY_DN5592_c0_g1_i5.p1  ORF type:complete len:349 (-),score=61.76 TRINITY_DN5592_c0_g1_i5:183-1229(-)